MSLLRSALTKSKPPDLHRDLHHDLHRDCPDASQPSTDATICDASIKSSPASKNLISHSIDDDNISTGNNGFPSSSPNNSNCSNSLTSDSFNLVHIFKSSNFGVGTSLPVTKSMETYSNATISKGKDIHGDYPNSYESTRPFSPNLTKTSTDPKESLNETLEPTEAMDSCVNTLKSYILTKKEGSIEHGSLDTQADDPFKSDSSTPSLSRHSRRSVARRRTYECKKCGIFYTEQSRVYLEHLRDVHDDHIQIYQCDVCSYACPNRHKLLRHRNSVHRELPRASLIDVVEVRQKGAKESKMAALCKQGDKTGQSTAIREHKEKSSSIFGAQFSEQSSIETDPDATAILTIEERQNIFKQVQDLFIDTHESFSDIVRRNLSESNLSSPALPYVFEKEDFDDIADSPDEEDRVMSDVNCNVLDMSKKAELTVDGNKKHEKKEHVSTDSKAKPENSRAFTEGALETQQPSYQIQRNESKSHLKEDRSLLVKPLVHSMIQPQISSAPDQIDTEDISQAVDLCGEQRKMVSILKPPLSVSGFASAGLNLSNDENRPSSQSDPDLANLSGVSKMVSPLSNIADVSSRNSSLIHNTANVSQDEVLSPFNGFEPNTTFIRNRDVPQRVSAKTLTPPTILTDPSKVATIYQGNVSDLPTPGLPPPLTRTPEMPKLPHSKMAGGVKQTMSNMSDLSNLQASNMADMSKLPISNMPDVPKLPMSNMPEVPKLPMSNMADVPKLPVSNMADDNDSTYDGDTEVEAITAAAERRQRSLETSDSSGEKPGNPYDIFNYTSGEEYICSPIIALSRMEKSLRRVWNNSAPPINQVKKPPRSKRASSRNVKETLVPQADNKMQSNIGPPVAKMSHSIAIKHEHGPSPRPGPQIQTVGSSIHTKAQQPIASESAYTYIKADVTSQLGEGSQYGCRLCRYASGQKWKVAHHVRHVHLRNAFYKCAQCDFVCKRKTEWTVHLVKHSGKRVHACAECAYKTVMKRNYTRHMLHHTTRHAAKCSYCSYSSSGEAAIQRHMSEFHPSPKQEKEHLEAQLAYHKASKAAAVRGMDVQRHLMGSPPSAVTSPFHVPVTSPEPVVFQTPEIPRNPFVYQGTSTSRSGSFSDSSTSSSKSNSLIGLHPCSECGAVFRGRSSLRSHMITHSNETPWACQFCPLRYKRKADLGAHMKNKHNMPLPMDVKPEFMPTDIGSNDPVDMTRIGASPSGCSQDQPLNLCVKQEIPAVDGIVDEYTNMDYDEEDDDEDEMKEDQPLDLSNKPTVMYSRDSLKCNHCSYIAKWPGDLRRHKLIHSIDRRFQCGMCPKKFKYHFDLSTHLRRVHKKAAPKGRVSKFAHQRSIQGRSSHVTELSPSRGAYSVPQQMTAPGPSSMMHQQLKCKCCDFIGKDKGELERHMSIHTGQKPWACLFCEYMSHWKGDMKRHLEKHHRTAIDKYGDIQHLLSQCYSMVNEDSDGTMNVDTAFFSGDSSVHTDSDSRASASPSPAKIFGINGEKCGGEPEIKQKILPDGSRKTLMKCPHCPYENEALSKVKTHMEIHGNLKRFMCPECGKRSNWVWDVRKHIRKEHPGGSMDVIQMTVDEARNSISKYLSENAHQVITHTRKRFETSPTKFVVLKAEIPEPGARVTTPPRRRTPVKPGTPSPSAKLRPFKCSECGRRSNWRWDLNKHIRTRHPRAELITLTEEEARNTIHEVAERQTRLPKSETQTHNNEESVSPPTLTPLKARDQVTSPYTDLSSPPKLDPQLSRDNVEDDKKPVVIPKYPSRRPHPEYIKKLVAAKFRPFKCSLCGKRSNWKWDVSKHMRINHPGQTGHVITLTEEEAKTTYHEVEIARLRLKLNREEQAVKNLEKKANEHSEAFSSLKAIRRFQCSVCFYRSNFKADVTKHITKQHSHVDDGYVIKLDADVARDTLEEYDTAHGSTARKHKHAYFPTPLSGVDLAKALSQVSQQRNMTNGSPKDSEDPTNSSMDMSDHSGNGSRSSSVCGTSGVKRDIYLCKKCSFYTTAQKAIITHYRVHGEEGIYRCTVCNERSDYKHSIVRHVQNRHGFTAYAEADKHITQRDIYTIIHGDPTELSQISNDASSSIDASEEAESSTQGFVVTMYKCTICGPMRSSDLRYSVVRHVRRVHPDIMNPEDYVDEFETVKPALSPSKIYNGTSDEVRDSSTVTESPVKVRGSDLDDAQKFAVYMAKKLKCEVCPFRTNKASHMKMHTPNHQPSAQNRFKCKYCDYYMTQPHNLRAHEKLHTMEQLYAGGSSASPVKRGAVLLPKTPTKRSGVALPKYGCDKCPFMSNKKNEFLYHRQFHRPKQAAQQKCQMCPFWCKDGRALKMHMVVHDADYLQKVHQVAPQDHLLDNSLLMASPCKSDISDMSVDDILESAELKQRIIASKVKSVAITPHKVRADPPVFPLASPDVMSSYVLNPNRHSLSAGMYKKFYKCKHCPWTNTRQRNLVLHERMHGKRDGKDLFKCPFCDYYVGNRGLLSHHIKVHSEQYRPGFDIINDVEGADLNKSDPLEAKDKDPDEETEAESTENELDSSEGILDTVDREETESRIIHHKNTTRMDMLAFPRKSDYYIKYSEGRHILEKAVLKKWCCEKCPYATMKKSQFEKHVSLHGSRQKYVCQYCDYSVPGYHLLLQHEKLHRMPNPNLLSVQSIANLTQLPEIPADVAATTQYAMERSDLGVHDHINALYEHTPQFCEPKKMYHCDRCPYSNVRRDHILAHLKFHMIRSEFKCDYCDYSVSKSHLMNQHVKVHFILPGSEMSSESPPEKLKSSEVVTAEMLPCPIAGEKDPLDLSATSQVKSQENSSTRDEQKKKAADEMMESNKEKEIDPMEVDTDVEDENLNVKKSLNDHDLDNFMEGVKRLSDRHELDDSSKLNKSINNNENSPSEKAKAPKISPKDGARSPAENGASKKSGTKELGPETVWVCQYCDRAFQSCVRLKQHEAQHLLGNSQNQSRLSKKEIIL